MDRLAKIEGMECPPEWFGSSGDYSRPCSNYACDNDGHCCGSSQHIESPDGIWFCWFCGQLCSPPGSSDCEFQQYIDNLKKKKG